MPNRELWAQKCAYVPPRMIFDRPIGRAGYLVYGVLDLLAGDGEEPPAGGPVAVTQREIAQRLGFGEATIRHAFGRLRRGGYIDYRQGTVYVLSRCPAPPPPAPRFPTALRWEVWERDDFRCRQCGVRRDLTVDHIIPRIAGGTDGLGNLQTLCRSCNSTKGTRRE